MANRERGEASFTVDGKTYTLKQDLHAWAVAQDAVAKGTKVPTMDEIRKKILAGSVLHIIGCFFGMLQTHHPEIETPQQAAALMERDELACSVAMMKAMGLAVPDAKDLKELEDQAARPPKAQAKRKAGTGDENSSRLAASA